MVAECAGPWTTTILSSDNPTALGQAVRWLRQGQVVAFPTDTVYGLGAALDDVAAVECLYRVKARPRHLAIPLLLSEASDLERVCREVPALAWRLAEHFWPGGLTLVLWRRQIVSDLVTGGRPTVAVRLPDHPVPRALACQLGRPLAATSANRSGWPTPVTAAEVREQLEGRIPLILDGGPCLVGHSSTIVDLTVDPAGFLRSGPVSREAIEAVLGRPMA